MMRWSNNNYRVYLKPSFYTHIISSFIFVYVNYLYFNSNLTNYENIMVLLLISIFISIHGLSHNLLEINYNWNPLKN